VTTLGTDEPLAVAAVEAIHAGDLIQALWYACHGGQLRAAEYALERGADLNWISTWDEHTPLDAARREGHDDVVEWLLSLGGKSAGELS
jgi:uncharacterized protein